MVAMSATYALCRMRTYSYSPSLLLLIDQSPKQNPIATMACIHPYIFVSARGASLGHQRSKTHSFCRDYIDFTVPPPFSSRVRNALNAEAKSVRLSALVGAGGHWYGFGKIIMRL